MRAGTHALNMSGCQDRKEKERRLVYNTNMRSRTTNTTMRNKTRTVEHINNMQHTVHLTTSPYAHILVASNIVFLLFSNIAYKQYNTAYLHTNRESYNQDKYYQAWRQDCLHIDRRFRSLPYTHYACNMAPTHDTDYTRIDCPTHYYLAVPSQTKPISQKTARPRAHVYTQYTSMQQRPMNSPPQQPPPTPRSGVNLLRATPTPEGHIHEAS